LVMDAINVVPLYQQIAEKLSEEAQALEAGAAFHSENDIAQRFRVSRVTACRALNQLVGDGALYRVKGKGTFVRGQGGGLLRSKRILFFLRQSLAVAVAAQDYIWAELAQGVVDEVCVHAQLDLCPFPNGVDEARFCVERIADPTVDGVVLLHWAGLDQVVRAAMDLRRPFALLNVKDQRLGGRNSVVANEEEGARQATQHLIDLGHRRIAFLGTLDAIDPTHQNPWSRVSGYQRALIANGIPVEPGLMMRRRPTPRESVPDVASLLDAEPGVTAIFAASDPYAVEVIRLLRSRGLRVPEDVSVVGDDDYPDAAEAAPPLTTVNKPRHEMGRIAARMVMEQIAKGFALLDEQVLEPRLVVRGSTAPPREP